MANKKKYILNNYYTKELGYIIDNIISEQSFSLVPKLAVCVLDNETKDKYFRLTVFSASNEESRSRIYGTVSGSDFHLVFKLKKGEDGRMETLKRLITEIFFEFSLCDTPQEKRDYVSQKYDLAGWNSELDKVFTDYVYGITPKEWEWHLSFLDESSPETENRNYNPNASKNYKRRRFFYEK